MRGPATVSTPPPPPTTLPPSVPGAEQKPSAGAKLKAALARLFSRKKADNADGANDGAGKATGKRPSHAALTHSSGPQSEEPTYVTRPPKSGHAGGRPIAPYQHHPHHPHDKKHSKYSKHGKHEYLPSTSSTGDSYKDNKHAGHKSSHGSKRKSDAAKRTSSGGARTGRDSRRTKSSSQLSALTGRGGEDCGCNDDSEHKPRLPAPPPPPPPPRRCGCQQHQPHQHYVDKNHGKPKCRAEKQCGCEERRRKECACRRQREREAECKVEREVARRRERSGYKCRCDCKRVC